jgi:hypothetical protein
MMVAKKQITNDDEKKSTLNIEDDRKSEEL